MNFLSGENTRATNFDVKARPIYKLVECKHEPNHWQAILTNADIPFLWMAHYPSSLFVSKILTGDEIKELKTIAPEATIIFPVS